MSGHIFLPGFTPVKLVYDPASRHVSGLANEHTLRRLYQRERQPISSSSAWKRTQATRRSSPTPTTFASRDWRSLPWNLVSPFNAPESTWCSPGRPVRTRSTSAGAIAPFVRVVDERMDDQRHQRRRYGDERDIGCRRVSFDCVNCSVSASSPAFRPSPHLTGDRCQCSV